MPYFTIVSVFMGDRKFLPWIMKSFCYLIVLILLLEVLEVSVVLPWLLNLIVVLFVFSVALFFNWIVMKIIILWFLMKLRICVLNDILFMIKCLKPLKIQRLWKQDIKHVKDLECCFSFNLKSIKLLCNCELRNAVYYVYKDTSSSLLHKMWRK